MPPASDLIRQLESGMTEDEQAGYAGKIAASLTHEQQGRLFWFNLITASDEIRARAIVEVKAPEADVIPVSHPKGRKA